MEACWSKTPNENFARLLPEMTEAERMDPMSWTGICAKPGCNRHLRNGSGVFCNNFWAPRGAFPPCRKCWCAGCYKERPELIFPGRTDGRVEEEDDDDPELVVGKEEEDRYRTARDGDHLLAPFECDLCSFRNLQGRDPVATSPQDGTLLATIRRVRLDVFWAREPSTVRGVLNTLRRDRQVAREAFGIAHPFPYRSPFPLEDKQGLLTACCFLMASLRKGITARTVQWDSARATTTAMSNLYRSGPDCLGGVVASKDRNKLRITADGTKSELYERFHKGSRLRMRITQRQDYALTSESVAALLELLEREWERSEGDEQARLEDLAVYVLCTFAAGLRGEEVPLMSLQGMLRFYAQGRRAKIPHVALALQGRFKGEEGERWHMIPIAEQTRTNLPVRLWFNLGMKRRQLRGWTGGWYFCSLGSRKRAKLSDYDGDFKMWMCVVKDTCPGVIPEAVDPMQDMSLRRSGRRGANTVAQNQRLTKNEIEIHNRWRKRERAKGATPSLDMVGTYTQMQEALQTKLRYSQCL